MSVDVSLRSEKRISVHCKKICTPPPNEVELCLWKEYQIAFPNLKRIAPKFTNANLAPIENQ